MASLALHLITVVLAVVFIVLGNIKLTPQFFPEYHNYAKNEFGKLNKEFPFYQLTGWRPYAKNYRLAVGLLEMTAGTLLLLGGVFSQSMATTVLLLIMTNMIIALQKLRYNFLYIGAAGFLIFALLARLFLAAQSKAVKIAKRNVENKEE